MHDRGSFGECQLYNLAGPPAAARRKPIPNSDQHVAMCNCRPASHHVSVEAVIGVTGQLEQAGGTGEQSVEPLPRAMVCEACTVRRPFERQDRLQLPAEFEGKLSGDLVRAVGDRGDETEARLGVCEAVSFALKQVPPRFLDQPQHVANALVQHRHAVLRQYLGPMPGDAHREHEWHGWRTAACRAGHGIRIGSGERFTENRDLPLS